MSSSKANKAKTAAVENAPATSSQAAPRQQSPSPIALCVSGDASAAHSAARAILADLDATEPRKAEAQAFLNHCAADRPTLIFFAIAWLLVLVILAMLYVV
ncbi:MAG: hypothetical protein LBM75_03475 [Myxococcales bacterium]|jgi:hypothetical protein|nr:hypothetical protein [Myxococcales bacterium]